MRRREHKQEEEGAQAGGDMEKLCSYIRESCSLDSTEACEAVGIVKHATNSYEGMIQLMALMTATKPGIAPIEAYTKARTVFNAVTLSISLPSVNKEAFAVKVPKTGNVLSSDILYLEKLCGIKGIPVINHVYSTSTAVFTTPVCLRLTPDVLFKGNLQRHLAQLVDILECAHERMVVHRDVRTENIMVADGLFVIVDWGYAVTLNDPVRYAGTTYFASARVLKLLEEGTTTFATEACDDLVSLVQSLSLLVRRNEEWRNKLYALSKMDYAGIRKYWEEHFRLPSDLLRLAQNTNYLELKNCIESWALSL